MQTEKTNVLIINFDHQALHQWSFYRDAAPFQPNFHQIAEKGCCFQSAYCAAPLCGPSRRTLLTGLYPHAHGQVHNETNPDYDHPDYIKVLSASGYDNYYFGKWHAGPGNALDHGCIGFSPNDYGNPYCTDTYAQYCAKYGIPPAQHLIEGCFHWASEGQRAYAKGTEAYPSPIKGELFQSMDPRHCCDAAYGVTVTPKESHESFFLARLASEALERIVRRADARPFCMRVDFWGPHYPYFPTQEYLDLYRDVYFPPYANFSDTLQNKPEVYHTERHVPIGVNNRITIPNALGWEPFEKMLHYCAAQITMLDDAAGIILRALETSGLARNTAILWTADHGDGLACHGGHFDKGSYLSQEVLRVPLAVYTPTMNFPTHSVSGPVSTVDFAATVLALAGVSAPGHSVGGRSLLGYIEGIRTPSAVLSESYGLGYGEYVTARAAITKDWKLIRTKGQRSELYDLSHDPFECNNLIQQPAYRKQQVEMERILLQLQTEFADSAH